MGGAKNNDLSQTPSWRCYYQVPSPWAGLSALAKESSRRIEQLFCSEDFSPTARSEVLALMGGGNVVGRRSGAAVATSTGSPIGSSALRDLAALGCVLPLCSSCQVRAIGKTIIFVSGAPRWTVALTDSLIGIIFGPALIFRDSAVAARSVFIARNASANTHCCYRRHIFGLSRKRRAARCSRHQFDLAVREYPLVPRVRCHCSWPRGSSGVCGASNFPAKIRFRPGMDFCRRNALRFRMKIQGGFLSVWVLQTLAMGRGCDLATSREPCGRESTAAVVVERCACHSSGPCCANCPTPPSRGRFSENRRGAT